MAPGSNGICRGAVECTGTRYRIYWDIYIYIFHKWNLKCLPGFQNDNLRHLEWHSFNGHAKCLKPAKIHTVWFAPKIVDSTVFWWHFPKKRLSKPKNDDPSRLFSLFCSSTYQPFDGHAKCMKPAKTHTNWLATLLQPPRKRFQSSLQDIFMGTGYMLVPLKVVTL